MKKTAATLLLLFVLGLGAATLIRSTCKDPASSSGLPRDQTKLLIPASYDTNVVSKPSTT